MTDKNSTLVTKKLLLRTAEALEKNNMNAFVVDTCKEALETAENILKEGAIVGCGGSVTLAQTGIDKLLRSGKYNFLDREKAEDKTKLYRETFFSDYYLCSANAVTQKGELYNVDGNGNRVACICYGPANVIVIVGKNKIVPNIAAAAERVKQLAAPANSERLSCDTYCRETGICMGSGKDIADGCRAAGRICSTYVISGYQRNKGRINVILVNESLGY